MKLKHVLFSGLLLSVGLTACTNDEFTVEQTPAVNTEDGIALGEGIVIAGTKGDAETRAVVAGDFSKALWETTDTIGAAWYNMITSYNSTTTGIPTGQAFTVSGSNVYASNTWFKFHEQMGDDMSYASFRSEANLMAGAYVLYFPYDPTITSSASFEGITVKLDSKQKMDCTAGKETAGVNENLFAYSIVPFIQGGEQTTNFELKQLTNVFAINFMVQDKNLMLLEEPVKIKKVIIKANDGTNSVLTADGSIKVPAATVDYGNEVYGTAKFTANNKANQLVLDVTNASNNYAITGLGEAGATKKPFYISALPFQGSSLNSFTVQVLTEDNKVYGTTYETVGNKVYDQVVKQAWKEGQLIQLGVILEDLDDEGSIFTKEQFEEQWEDAINATDGKEQVLTIAEENLDLTGVKLPALDKNVKIKLTGSSVKMESLDLTNGTLTVDNKLTVAGDLNIGSNAKGLTTTGNGVLNVEGKLNVEGGTSAFTITTGKVNDLVVTSSGIIKITGTEASGKVNGTVGAITNEGELTLASIIMSAGKTVANSGTLTLDGAGVSNNGTITNSGEFVMGSDAFNNNGTFNQNGTVTTTGEFKNNAGATLNINTSMDKTLKVINAAAAQGKPAAVININSTGTTATTLTVDGTKPLTNNGVVNVNAKSVLTASTANSLVNEGSAEIRVADNATLTLAEAVEGYVVAETDATIDGTTGTTAIAAEISEASDLDDVNASANTLFIKTNLTVNSTNANTLNAKNLVLYNNLILDTDLAMTASNKVVVADNVVVTGTAATKTLTLQGTENEILAGAALTIGNNAKLAGAASTELTQNGTLGTTGNGSIEYTNLKIK